MRSGPAGPHSEHAQPATATARSSSQTGKRLEFFVCVLMRTLLGRVTANTLDSNSQTMAESITPQETSGTSSPGKRGNLQIFFSCTCTPQTCWTTGDPVGAEPCIAAIIAPPPPHTHTQRRRLVMALPHAGVTVQLPGCPIAWLQQAQRPCSL